jgi:hypothetical protein
LLAGVLSNAFSGELKAVSVAIATSKGERLEQA